MKERKELCKFLRWGDKTAIANLAQVSRQTLERWINGKTTASTVEPYFVAFALKRKQEIEQRINVLGNLEKI